MDYSVFLEYLEAQGLDVHEIANDVAVEMFETGSVTIIDGDGKKFVLAVTVTEEK